MSAAVPLTVTVPFRVAPRVPIAVAACTVTVGAVSGVVVVKLSSPDEQPSKPPDSLAVAQAM